jgi:hypothetical protein
MNTTIETTTAMGAVNTMAGVADTGHMRAGVATEVDMVAVAIDNSL